MALLDYRPMYRSSNVLDTNFFTQDSKINRAFAEEDLARSGLTTEDMAVDYPGNLRLVDKALAGYNIPYFDLEGNVLIDRSGNLTMRRTRLKFPEFSRESRYTQPNTEELSKSGLPAFLPYFHPKSFTLESDYVICAEGEKKTASVIRYLDVPAFGLGGCQMWRDPSGSGSVHPWIRDYLHRRNINTVVIVPDGDVFRYDICKAYGTFARALEAIDITVRIVNCPAKIDDLLVQWGKDAKQNFSALGAINSNDLVQSPSSLIDKYGLAFRRDSKDRPVVHQHSSNVTRLLEEHNAFPKIWRNLDNNKVMIGEDPAQPDYTEMQMTNYLQHNLGFDKVTHRLVYSCIQSLSKANARSPMLDYIRAQTWDGVKRLDSWLERLWGVPESTFSYEVASKWLISACARMDKPGTKLDWMFIVIGPQKTGKTTMPSILFKGANLTLYGEQNDKDLHMLLHSALCVGFDELDSFGRRETSNLKAMVTRNEDAFRPPYGASVELFPRRFTLYGCGNRHEFLQNDPSGHRRYAIVEVTRLLDFAGLEAERDQLWAEAWVRYQSGREQYWEVEGASENAQNYTLDNPLEDQIRGWVEAQKMNKSSTSVKDGQLYFNMSQLLIGIGSEKDITNPNATREIAAILRDLGADRVNSRGRPVPGVPAGRHYIISVD
jgi:Virulence-associated protein E